MIIIIISNGNRTEWSPIRSVIITSDKQNWTSEERVMITDRIDDTKSYNKYTIKVAISEHE